VQRAEITKLLVDELRQEIGMHDTTSASIEGRFALRGLDLLSCSAVLSRDSFYVTYDLETNNTFVLHGGLRPDGKMRGRCRSFIVSR
jgi:hypothetical protein